MEKTIELSDERREELAKQKFEATGGIPFKAKTMVERAVKSLLPRITLKRALKRGVSHVPFRPVPTWATSTFNEGQPIQVSGVWGTQRWFVMDMVQRLRSRPMPLYKALEIMHEATKRLEAVDAEN